MKKPQFLIVLCLPILQSLNWLGEGKALRVSSFICSLQELATISCASVPALQDQQGTNLPAF